jgi:hypothetical protein
LEDALGPLEPLGVTSTKDLALLAAAHIETVRASLKSVAQLRFAQQVAQAKELAASAEELSKERLKQGPA